MQSMMNHLTYWVLIAALKVKTWMCEGSEAVNCSIYASNEDSYRICRIFVDANITQTHSSIWMSNSHADTAQVDICEWDSTQNYIECDYVFHFNSSVTDRRLVKLDLSFSGGELYLDPADDYPWPRFLQYIDLHGSDSLHGVWRNFSNLPNVLNYFSVSDMTELVGNLDFSTLPRTLQYLYYDDTNLYAHDNDLSGLPQNLTRWDASRSNLYLSADKTFDWEHLPNDLEYLTIRTMDLVGTVNLTNLPPRLYYIDGGFNNFDEIVLPSVESGIVHTPLQTLSLDFNEIDVNIGELNFTVFSDIITIDLTDNANIYGTIHWQNFPSSLETLYLGYNAITFMDDCHNASIACGIDNMDNLKYLDLSDNQLSGTVNWQMFTHVNNLITLSFGNNELEGTIDFSKLPSTLTSLKLYDNAFHGNITNFGHLRNLDYWYMYGNNLNGTVDWSQFARLTSIFDVEFQNNELHGDIDCSYIAFENLEGLLNYFTWQSNSFDGTLNLGNMTSLVNQVSLNDNPDITGGVDFSSIVSTSTTYPSIWLDTTVYCKTHIYCSHLLCAIPQPRTTRDCDGKTECESTCGECVPCSTTSPTIIPSSVPTAFPVTQFPSNVPIMDPIIMYHTSTTSIPQPPIHTSANYNTFFSSDDTHGTDKTITTEEGLVGGETGTNGSFNGLSDSHVMLLIVSGLVAVSLLICAVGCAFCLTAYLKHKERMKEQEMTQMTQMTRQSRISLQPSVAMRTWPQHNQIGIDSQSNLNISSDMILANTNSQFKVPMQQQIMGDVNTVNGSNDGVDAEQYENINVKGSHLQTGEVDSNVNDNVNDDVNDKPNKLHNSSTNFLKEHDNNDNDDSDTDGNVQIRYKQVSSTDIKKNVVDVLVCDHAQRQTNSGTNVGLYYD